MAILFESSFKQFSGGNFDGFNTTYPGGAGESINLNSNTGLAGDSMRLVTTATDSQLGVFKSLGAGSTARYLEFWLRIGNGATLTGGAGNDSCILDVCTDINFSTHLAQIRIQNSSSGKYKIGLVSNFTTYSVTYSTNEFKYGSLIKFALHVTDSGFELYSRNLRLTEATLTSSNSGKNIVSFFIGKNGGTSFGSSTIDVADVRVSDGMGSLPSTDTAKALDTLKGVLSRFVSVNGAVHTMFDEVYYLLNNNNGGGTNNEDKLDGHVVSEGIGYALLGAIDTNDKYTFDKIESFAYSKLDRRNIQNDSSIANSSDTQSVAKNCMGWIFDPIANKTKDANLATDADIDRVSALLKAHYKWGSSGDINYLSRALAIAGDLKQFCFQSWNGKNYQSSDKYANNEYNASYITPSTSRELSKLDTANSTFWASAVDGAYDLYSKVTATTGGLSTTTGLFPNWATFNENDGSVALPPSSRDTKYTYDAIRTPLRIAWDFIWYNETRAQTQLSGNIYSFMSGQWNNGAGTIKAEYNHDGTVSGNYENNLMYALNSFIFKVQGNTTQYDNIWNTKIKPSYVQHPSGSYIASEVGGISGNSKASYFGSFLTALAWGTRENILTNLQGQFGAVTAGTPTAAKTAITASPPSIVANGLSSSTITISLYDAAGVRVTSNSGSTITLSTTLGSLSGVTSRGDGTFSATLTSSNTAGTATVSGTLNGTNITNTASVTMSQARYKQWVKMV